MDKELIKKVFELKKKIGPIQKNGRVKYHIQNNHKVREEKEKYKYIMLDDIMDTINPLLNDASLIIIHQCNEIGLTTSICDVEDGTSISSTIPRLINQTTEQEIEKIKKSHDGKTNTNLTQEMGKDITYYKRYNICCLLDIIADDDVDANRNNELKVSKKEIFTYDTKKEHLYKQAMTGKSFEEFMQITKKQYVVSVEDEKKLLNLYK